jgi:hypothetical protein
MDSNLRYRAIAHPRLRCLLVIAGFGPSLQEVFHVLERRSYPHRHDLCHRLFPFVAGRHPVQGQKKPPRGCARDPPKGGAERMGVWGDTGGEVVVNKINNLQTTLEPWRDTVEVNKINRLQTTLEGSGGVVSATIVLVANQANGL